MDISWTMLVFKALYCEIHDQVPAFMPMCFQLLKDLRHGNQPLIIGASKHNITYFCAYMD